MPTVRQPASLAICPTAEPTDPAAVDTTTVSPGLGSPTSVSAKYAVTPLSPSTPSASDSGRSVSVTLRRMGRGSVTAYSCQPSMPITRSPSA